MELEKYYSLDEVIDRDIIIGTLKKMKRDGFIDFKIEMSSVEYFSIDDLGLDENVLEDLLDLFEENDVLPYLDIDDDAFGDNDWGFDDY